MLRPGEMIAHYKLISAIGKGGMGEVYLAEDTKLGRRVAIKILLPDVAEDADRLRRFVQEAKAASALNHPNILTVYEIGEYRDSHYIAAEFIRGETLRERMRHGNIALTEAIGIAIQAAAALSAAHESGILHRDIKPENIMVRDDGLVKVLDFGLAKLTEKPETVPAHEAPTIQQIDTIPGLLVGTIAYMSPEQVRSKKLDGRTDVFSLGTVMYELFTGHFPFKGEGHLDLASSVLKDDPAPLRQISPNVPRQLERIVDKAMRKQRENRYQHIKDLKIDLEDLQDELRFEAKQAQTAEQVIPPTVTQRVRLSETISTKPRFTLLHAMIFIVFATAIIGAVWFLRRPDPQPQRNYKSVEIASWDSAPGELFNNAKFSPDGRMIAFSSTKSGSKNIWLTQAGSSAAIPVTNDLFSNTEPVWSPKGDEIAFLSIGRANRPGIWRVSALGGGMPRQIGTVDGAARIRRWTSSGKIYYQLGEAIYALDVGSGASQKVMSFDGQNVRFADIANDEKTVLFATENNNEWRLATGSASGVVVSEIAKGVGRVDGIAWLPEKQRVLFSATANEILQVFAAGTGSGPAVQLSTSDTDLSVADVAPDGRSIIVTSSKEESNLWRVTVADGREDLISRDVNTKVWPAVSPDNSRIAFQSIKSLSQGDKLFDTPIVARRIQGAIDNDGTPALTEHGFLPTWSPDGKWLAVLRRISGAVDVFLLDPNGGAERRVAGEISTAGYSISPYNYAQATAFSWSPDSSLMAYVSKKSGASNVWMARLSDTSETMLTANNDPLVSYQCPAWSTDGKSLSFSFARHAADQGAPEYGLNVFRFDTRQVTMIYQTAKDVRLLGWNNDETGLIFAERDTQKTLVPELAIRRITLTGSPPTMVADLKNIYFYNIFLSDDRKTIAYAARENDRDDLWTISCSGGAARKLTSNNDPGLYYSRLAWLHDGSAIVYGKQTRFSLLSMITDLDL